MNSFDARDLNLSIAPSELKPLFKIKPHKHVMAIIANWLIILATIYFSIQFFNPLVYVLAVIVVGARMHALAILMHDATHFRFLKNRKWNDLISNVTTMYPLFTAIENYRDNHLQHHQHLNTEHDPDWFAKLGKKEFQFPKTKQEFLISVLSYFTLYQGIKDAFWFLKRFSNPDKKPKISRQTKLIKIGFYLTMVICLTVFGLWKIYALYWLVPYLSTFFMFQYIRSVAEHFGDLAYDNLLTSTRSVKASALERFIIAPHNVGYHIEHHLYPGVPYYNLPKLHQLLMQVDNYNNGIHLTQGYMKGLMNELGG